MTIDDSAPPPLPARDPAGHKGTFGTTLIIGGCGEPGATMIGAPALAARAALRAGCGLARILAPAPIVNETLVLSPSATAAALPADPQGRTLASPAAEIFDRETAKASAVVIGCGMGPHGATPALALRAIQYEDAPVIADADALNALAAMPDFARDVRAALVLTPHPGEYRRLAAALNLTADPIEPSCRPDAAAMLAQRLGCIVVLKGADTVVSDGQRTWVHRSSTPSLATGGTGDVLAGLIGGLAAQHVRLGFGVRSPLSLYDAARIAVSAHSAAAERWQRRSNATGGLLPQDLADELPAVIESLRAAR